MRQRYKARVGWFEMEVHEPAENDSTNADDLIQNESSKRNTDWIEMKLIAKQPFYCRNISESEMSKTIIEFSKACGLTVVSVFLNEAEPPDLGGTPVVIKDEDDRNVQETKLPEWVQLLYDNPNDDFLVLFQKLDEASIRVQHSLKSIISESVICGYKFDNVWFGATGENTLSSDSLRSLFIREHAWK